MPHSDQTSQDDSKWYAKRGDRVIGPVALSKLQELAETGKLRPNDQVRLATEQDWQPASDVLAFAKQPSSVQVQPLPLSVASSQTETVRNTAQPFINWYKVRWLYSLRWFYQVPIWLAYGFVWIPIWYVSSATPPGGLRARWASLSITGKAVACLPLLVFLVLPSGSSRRTIDSGNIGSEVSTATVNHSWDRLCTVGLPERLSDEFCAAISTNGDTLLICLDNEAFLYEIPSCELKATIHSHEVGIKQAAVSPDGNYVALTSVRTIGIWDVSAKTFVVTLDGLVEGNTTLRSNCTFSPDGRTLAISATGSSNYPPSKEPQVKLFDTSKWKLKSTLPGRHPVSFSSDSTLLAMDGVEPGTAVIWNLADERELSTLTTTPVNEEHYHRLCFNNDASEAYGLSERELTVWSVDNGKQKNAGPIRLDSGFREYHFSKDGSFLATLEHGSTNDGMTLKLHDLNTNQSVVLHEKIRLEGKILISGDSETVGCLLTAGQFELWRKRTSSNGEFRFSAPDQLAFTQDKPTGATGPNGEIVLLGSEGSNSIRSSEYYLNEVGERVLHGVSKDVVTFADTRGKCKDVSIYEAGKLIRQEVKTDGGDLVKVLERQSDGTYLWDELETLAPGIQIRHRSVASHETTANTSRTRIIKKLDTALSIHGREVEGSPQYLAGFQSGLNLALSNKRAVDLAKGRGDDSYLNVLSLIQRDAPGTIAKYQNLAIKQMEAGSNADEMNGMVAGLSVGYAQLGISLK